MYLDMMLLLVCVPSCRGKLVGGVPSFVTDVQRLGCTPISARQ